MLYFCTEKIVVLIDFFPSILPFWIDVLLQIIWKRSPKSGGSFQQINPLPKRISLNPKVIMDVLALSTIIILTLIVVLVVIYFVIRCLTQGKICQSRARLEGKTVVITGADTAIGIELVREMCKRGAERVIMAVENVEIGQVMEILLCCVFR